MKHLLALMMLLVLFSNCKKDTDITDITQSTSFPIVNVESSLTGLVTDESNSPLANVDVSVAGLKLKTDDNGRFFVSKKLMNKYGEWVKVESNGYFTTGRFAFQNLNNSNFIQIKMIQLPNSQSFSSDVDFIANVQGAGSQNGGGTIKFAANSFVTSDGQAYKGIVYSSIKWLDPSGTEIFDIMPGDLRAIDSKGYTKVLKTFGMFGVELYGNTGQKLNLAPGALAEISMTVPSTMLGSAPATIPLWHFDLDKGTWIEEGEAKLQNGKYVGMVSHFSFWNCDTPADFAKINGMLVNNDGSNVQGVQVEIVSTNYGTGYGYTDNNGMFGGLVPANEALTLKIHDSCGDVLYTKAIGPFSNDTDLGKITVTFSKLITISGKLLDCNNNPLGNGLVYLANDTAFVAQTSSKADGTFEISFSNCAGINSLNLTAYDYANPLQSNPLVVQLYNNPLDVGSILVCTTLDEYIVVEYQGVTQSFSEPTLFSQGVNFLSLVGYGKDSSNIELTIIDISNNIGTPSGLYITLWEGNIVHQLSCTFCQTCGCDPNDKVIFTKIGATGDYTIGTLSGIHTDSLGAKSPYNISFKAKLQ